MAELELKSEVTGRVWTIASQIGDRISEGDALLVLESMKMEIPLLAPSDGIVVRLLVGEGQEVVEGQTLAILKT